MCRPLRASLQRPEEKPLDLPRGTPRLIISWFSLALKRDPQTPELDSGQGEPSVVVLAEARLSPESCTSSLPRRVISGHRYSS